jgi:hypothetical protein
MIPPVPGLHGGGRGDWVRIDTITSHRVRIKPWTGHQQSSVLTSELHRTSSELYCTPKSELRRTPMSYTAPTLSYTAPTLSYTAPPLSYPTPLWATAHPLGATLHPLWTTHHPSELHHTASELHRTPLELHRTPSELHGTLSELPRTPIPTHPEESATPESQVNKIHLLTWIFKCFSPYKWFTFIHAYWNSIQGCINVK